MKAKNDRRPPSTSLPKPLTVSEVFAPCPTTHFKFKTTKELKSSHDIIAQDRAIRAINMGLGIRRPGYNIYVAGIQGTGKTSVIRQFLEKWSSNSPPPNDWIYIYNFSASEQPKAVEMPRGDAKVFKKRMEALVKAFKAEIPAALQSEDYENAVNAYLGSANERKSKLFNELEKLGKGMDFVIKSSRMGIETVPVVEGRSITEKEYNKLAEVDRERIEGMRSKLEPEVLDFARKVRAIEQESREFVENLRADVGGKIISTLIEPLMQDYAELVEIHTYLKQLKDDAVENLLDFVEEEAKEEAEEEASFVFEEKDRFTKYKVNVFVDNSQTQAAPVVLENNPTYYNLFGKIEKNVEHGMYLTDFTMIKPGAIQRANGGYLVLNALDIFRNGSTWDTLKRVLRNRKAFIEDMGEQYSLLPTSGLRPEAIPLDLKVILIGNDDIYHTLYQEDEEFNKIFKIKADFDFKMERTPTNILSYVAFIATRAQLEGLLSFDRSGVAAIVEFSSRLVEDQRLLSTQFGEIKDLTIEADFIAREQGAKLIKAEHVQEALNQKFYRLNLQEENLLEMVRTEDILVAVEGDRIGQVNGLAVYDYGDYSFGKIGRITCTTGVSDHGIINIERASRLSGKIHDKGVYILTGFLNAVLAREKSLGVSASVCFEQSYGIIDGDSASCAELISIISALANIPVKQTFAITGSINQLGDIQPVGGINEKIEGFHKVCQLLGGSGQHGVIIPYQNVSNLMLHQSVQDDVKKGTFKIYPVRHVWEAFELATGVALGVRDIHKSGEFAKHSALAIILNEQKKLGEHDSEPDEDKKKSKQAPPQAKRLAARPRKKLRGQ